MPPLRSLLLTCLASAVLSPTLRAQSASDVVSAKPRTVYGLGASAIGTSVGPDQSPTVGGALEVRAMWTHFTFTLTGGYLNSKRDWRTTCIVSRSDICLP